jgi:Uma2 family endonuclease
MTYAQYLELERSSELKHEYLRGEVFAMAGGSPEHARLDANVIRGLGAALRGRPCAVFTSDARVRIEVTDRATYPDVTVVCGRLEHAPKDPDSITNPALPPPSVDEVYRDPLAVGGP